MGKSKLLEQVRQEIRRRNYSYRTETSYSQWIVRYVRFHNLQHPMDLNESRIVPFLNDLANRKNVAASTLSKSGTVCYRFPL
jgi:hypothetical protein